MMEGGLFEVAAKVGLAAILGGIVGAEREWTGKWAGLRTHMLIAVGSAFLTHVSVLVGSLYGAGSNAWDPGRIAAQIVSGVGFIGAGTIIQSRGSVHGLTTAAGLWVASAIGIAVGAGFYAESTLVAVVLLLILTVLRPVERRLFRGMRQTVVVQLEPGKKTSDLIGLLEREGFATEDVSITDPAEERTVRVRFRGRPEDAARLVRCARGEGLVSATEDTSRPPFP
jgi:putative Mg2+ transporter-C (MgtC) family protein